MNISYFLIEKLQGIGLALPGAVSQGVLWAVMALGVYITFRLLNFADMTVDGSFALGGCVSALLITEGWNPFATLIISLAAGLAAGLVTGILHTKLKIPGILSGILTMIALYSINLRIMSGASNKPLLGQDTMITLLGRVLPLKQSWLALVLGVFFAVLVIIFLYWFFGTEIGCALRATGDNEYMVRALGEDTDKTKIIALMLCNGLVSLSGGLVAQNQGYGDVGMGTGTIVIGLASIVIGEVVFGNRFNFAYKLISIVVGSALYRVIIAIVLQLGLNSSDLKLFTAIIVAAALSIPVLAKKKA